MEKKHQEPSDKKGFKKIKADEKVKISANNMKDTTSEILKSRQSSVFLYVNDKKVEFRLVEIAPSDVLEKNDCHKGKSTRSTFCK